MKKWLKRISIGFVAIVVVLVTIPFTYERVSRIVASKNYSPEGYLIDVGGHKLHLLRRGTGGPTVVFESGLDGNGHLPWYKVGDEVSLSATTISYDRAGILWSERGSKAKTAEAMSEDLSTLLRIGGFPKPYILVGHSLAGLTLRPFIVENAEDIAGIVFVDTSHPAQFDRMPPELTQTPSRGVMHVLSSFGLIRLSAAASFPNTDPEDRINTVGTALSHNSISAVLDEIESIEVLAEEAKQITSFGDIPLIVITGASPTYNDMYPEEFREEMALLWNELQSDLLSLSTDSRQILAPESGHYVQLDQPDIVIREIRNIISDIQNN